MACATHYGIHVDSLEGAREQLGRLGFASIEPAGPRRYRREADDEVGSSVAWAFGDVFAAEITEAPWGQQLELIEVDVACRVPRASAYVDGDTTVAIPVADPAEAAALLGLEETTVGTTDLVGTAFGGQRLLLTSGPAPWATIHYSRAGWERARPFLIDALGLQVEELEEGRFDLTGGGARVEVLVRDTTAQADPAAGKRYVGTGHVALTGVDVERVIDRLPHHEGARFLLPPSRWGGVLHGPANDGFEVHAGT